MTKSCGQEECGKDSTSGETMWQRWPRDCDRACSDQELYTKGAMAPRRAWVF